MDGSKFEGDIFTIARTPRMSPAAIARSATIVLVGTLVGACQPPSSPAPASGAAGKAEKGETTAKPATHDEGPGSAANAEDTGGVVGDAASPTGSALPTCEQLVDHELEVYRTTGSAALLENLPDRDTVLAHCARSTMDPTAAACSLAATDVDAVAECSRVALANESDVSAVRSFQALALPEDADPKPMTVDRDYLAFSDTCGVLYREIYPAGGVFLICDGRIAAGPMVTPAEINTVFNAISEESANAHALVTSIQANWPAGGTAKLRVHKYGADGSYLGVE